MDKVITIVIGLLIGGWIGAITIGTITGARSERDLALTDWQKACLLTGGEVFVRTARSGLTQYFCRDGEGLVLKW